MTKTGIAILAVLGLATSARPAHASCGNQCPQWLDTIGGLFVIGIIGGYAAGTGYFIYRDATDEEQSLKYAATEAGVNAGLGALWTVGIVDAASRGAPGELFAYGGLAAVHGTLAVHGAWRAYQERPDLGSLHGPDHLLDWAIGIGYTANTLVWTFGLGGEHGRAYGITEAAVNAPIAVGLGYLAIDRARDGERGRALIYGGMALVSGALTAHGVKTAISPVQTAALDLLGTDVAPTVVSDGREVAPGLAATGTW